MKLFLLRLWAAIVLLVATAVPSERVSAQTYAAHGRQHEECVQQHDLLGTSQAEERQRPYGEAIVKTLPLQRIGSSRPPGSFQLMEVNLDAVSAMAHPTIRSTI